MPELMTRMLRRKSQGTWFVEGPLVRCMNIFDLTILGLGGLIDAGIYVVIGQIALTLAGPAVIISFAIAAVAAVLAGLCYAELSSRITKTGSAYVFTYVILGELWAFIAGWSMVAEYLVGAASTARAFTGYINSLTNDGMFLLFRDKLGWGDQGLFGDFPNFPALALVIIAMVIVGVGVRESKTFMDGVISINGAALLSAMVAGIVLSNPENWSSLEKFAPNGIKGILMAAPNCFYCLSGFDAVPTASEEAIEPRRDIPRAILISLGMAILAYTVIIIVMTMMVPYSSITYYAPLAEAFKSRGFLPGYYIVSIGALCAIFGSLLASLYAVTRLFYSIAYDGLISTCIAHVGENCHVPTRAVICAGIMAGLLALFLEMSMLVELVSIATIATYTLVSICVLLSRYQADVSSVYLDGYLHTALVTDWLQKKIFPESKKSKAQANYQRISQRENELVTYDDPTPSKLTKDTYFSAAIALILLMLCLIGFWVCLDILILDSKGKVDPVVVSLACVYGTASICAVTALFLLPKNNVKFPFMMPMIVPILSIVINTFIMARIHWMSYLMFCTWIAVGTIIYISYGFGHSTESHTPETDQVLMEYAFIPVPLPTGTEVIRPIQRNLPQENPLAAFDDFDPEEWRE